MNEKTTLKAVLEQIEKALTRAIVAKQQGTVYMYVAGTKCIQLSVEDISLTDKTEENTAKEGK